MNFAQESLGFQLTRRVIAAEDEDMRYLEGRRSGRGKLENSRAEELRVRVRIPQNGGGGINSSYFKPEQLMGEE